MPLFLPDPTYTALQAFPGRRFRRNWAGAMMPPAGPDTYDFGSASTTGTDIYDAGSASTTGTDIYDGGTA